MNPCFKQQRPFVVFQVLGIVVDVQPGWWQVWSMNGLNKPQQVRVYPDPTDVHYILATADGKNSQEEPSLSLAV